MPDTRQHRGPAPGDPELFGEGAHPALRAAVEELSWLLDRGYAEVSALELVGNRHSLRKRQRTAVRRCACTEVQRRARAAHQVDLGALRDQTVHVDGFNALIVTESALSGAVVLIGRDRAHRDLASVHGTWRRIEATARAIEVLGDALSRGAPRAVCWRLDRAVGNSGRLRAMLLEHAAERGWPWTVELDSSPDRVLATVEGVVATGDAWILDQAAAWIDLPAAVIADEATTWRVDLGA